MRILLADDQKSVRFGLRTLLEQQPGWQVVGEATDAQELLNQTRVTCPDLVLLDWGLPGMGEEKLIAALKRNCPDLRVIVFSGRLEIQQEALDAGADKFISKTNPPEQLLAAIQAFDQNKEPQSGCEANDPPDE